MVERARETVDPKTPAHVSDRRDAVEEWNMHLIRRLIGGAKPVEETDEFGVKKLSNRELAHQLALGKGLLEHTKGAKKVVELHSDPERQKYWRERIASNDDQVTKKVSALEAEMNRRAIND